MRAVDARLAGRYARRPARDALEVDRITICASCEALEASRSSDVDDIPLATCAHRGLRDRVWAADWGSWQRSGIGDVAQRTLVSDQLPSAADRGWGMATSSSAISPKSSTSSARVLVHGARRHRRRNLGRPAMFVVGEPLDGHAHGRMPRC